MGSARPESPPPSKPCCSSLAVQWAPLHPGDREGMWMGCLQVYGPSLWKSDGKEGWRGRSGEQELGRKEKLQVSSWLSIVGGTPRSLRAVNSNRTFKVF